MFPIICNANRDILGCTFIIKHFLTFFSFLIRFPFDLLFLSIFYDTQICLNARKDKIVRAISVLYNDNIAVSIVLEKRDTSLHIFLTSP